MGKKYILVIFPKFRVSAPAAVFFLICQKVVCIHQAKVSYVNVSVYVSYVYHLIMHCYNVCELPGIQYMLRDQLMNFFSFLSHRHTVAQQPK